MAMTPRDILEHEFNKKRGRLPAIEWIDHLKGDLIYHLIRYVDGEVNERKKLAREIKALRAEVEALKNAPSLADSPWIGGPE